MAKKSKTKKKPQSRLKQKSNRHWYVYLAASVGAILAIIILWFSSGSVVSYGDIKTAANQDNKFQINVPSQMAKAQSSLNIIDYTHRKSSDSQELLSHIRVESQFLGAKQLEQTKADIITQLKAGNGQYFDFFKQKSSINSAATNLQFEKFSDFNQQSSIQSLTSSFSYSYGDVKVVGELLIAFSSDSIYIITVEATEDIWSSNYGFWQKSLESFKVN